MSLFSLFAPRRSAPASRKPASVRLRVEALEDRSVPAVLTPTVAPDLGPALVADLAQETVSQPLTPVKLQGQGGTGGVKALAGKGQPSPLAGHYNCPDVVPQTTLTHELRITDNGRIVDPQDFYSGRISQDGFVTLSYPLFRGWIRWSSGWPGRGAVEAAHLRGRCRTRRERQSSRAPGLMRTTTASGCSWRSTGCAASRPNR